MFILFYHTLTTDIYTLSLHDALPIWIFLMSRKIILIKQELLLLVYELNRSGLLAENEKIRKQAVVDRKSGSAGMPRPISYAVFCLKKKNRRYPRFSQELLSVAANIFEE